MVERIAAAACRHLGDVFHLPPPARHWNVIQHIVSECNVPKDAFPICPPDDQGFVTDTGRFVGRVEARKIAEAANQIIDPMDKDGIVFRIEHSQLFSEDLW